MPGDAYTSAQGSLRGTLIRGGTSRGLFVNLADFPAQDDLRDTLAIELFGTPDPLQIDGIGGSKSHTSKLMLVSPSTREDVDVEYTFAQVGVDEAEVGWSRNCGNLTSAVGVFSILEGFVDAHEPRTRLTLYNTNTDTLVEQDVPVAAGEPDVYGDYSIDGIPGTGARIDSSFRNPGGGTTGSLFPTGDAVYSTTIDGVDVELSVVDATNLTVFVGAGDLGLNGTELPDEIEEQPTVLDAVDAIRERVRDELELADAKKSQPSIGIVSEPQSYECSNDRTIRASDIDITARFISLQPHHAIPMTGAMCLTAAMKIPGTIPNRSVTGDLEEGVTIGHPKGTVSLDAEISNAETGPRVTEITNRRTARPVMSGQVYFRYVDGLEELRPAR